MKRLLALVLFLGFTGVAGFLSWRALRLRPALLPNVPPVDSALVKADVTSDRLAASLTFATISTQDSATWNPAPFVAFRDWLTAAFPRVHEGLTREVVNGYSLLYTWTGSDLTLAPMLLMGHFDVVPVEAGPRACGTAHHSRALWPTGLSGDGVRWTTK